MRDAALAQLQHLQPSLSGEDTLRMDQETFCALYERTSRPLWAYLWRRTGDRQLADDLLQETYYRFLRTHAVPDREQYRKNYLFRIATNLLRDNWRRRRDMDPLLENDSRLASDSDAADRSQRGQDLQRAMSKLEPRHRDAVWLAYAEGASHEEIAAILGMKVQSVKSTLFRAKRKLAELLGGSR